MHTFIIYKINMKYKTKNKIMLILDIKDISCDIATDMLMIFFYNKRINGIVPRDY